jgi:hypothetical protein
VENTPIAGRRYSSLAGLDMIFRLQVHVHDREARTQNRFEFFRVQTLNQADLAVIGASPQAAELRSSEMKHQKEFDCAVTSFS